MTHRWKKAAVLLFAFALLTSCSAQPEVLTDEPQEEAETSQVVFYLYEDELIPVSLSQEGQSLLTEEEYWYFEIEEQISNQEKEQWKDETFFLYHSEDCEIVGQASYDELKERMQELDADFAASQQITLFPEVLSWQSYTLEQQSQIDPVCRQAVADILELKGLYHTPVYISQIAQCDIDHDGSPETFVKASNFQTLDAQGQATMESEDLATADGTGYYTIDLMIGEKFGTFQLSVDCTPVSNMLGEYFHYDLNQIPADTRDVQQCMLTYQQKADGTIGTLPYYAQGEFTPLENHDVLVADLNGDGQNEVLIFSGNQSERITIFTQQDNTLLESYQVVLPE